MKKTILGLFVVVALMTTVIACDDKNKQAATTNDTAVGVDSTQATSSTSEPSVVETPENTPTQIVPDAVIDSTAKAAPETK